MRQRHNNPEEKVPIKTRRFEGLQMQEKQKRKCRVLLQELPKLPVADPETLQHYMGSFDLGIGHSISTADPDI